MADTNLAFISLLTILYFFVCPRPVQIPIKDLHVFVSGGSCALTSQSPTAALRRALGILARDHAMLKAAKQEIKVATGADVSVFSADVRDFAAIKKAAGAIDVSVCNQGVFMAEEMEKQSQRHYSRK